MLRLRKILLCNYLYLVLLILIIILTILRINLKPKLFYDNKYYEVIGTIENINIDGNKLILDIKSREELIGTYYFKNIKEKNKFNLLLGDKVKIKGEIISPNIPTNDNVFNYNKYLRNKSIYHLIKIDCINKLSSNDKFYYKVKNKIIDRMNNNAYLYTFIIGDKSLINDEVKSSYQVNGISHLFAISGMHISLLSSIILVILSKLKVRENYKYLIVTIFLVLYLFLTGLSPSIIRGVLFFIVFSYNKLYYFYISPINLFILVLCITLCINPFYIYEVSFLYSFLISLALLLSINYLSTGNYLIRLLKVSTISFLVSIPISLYNFYEINILGIIYNLFFVPLVSLIIFPLSLITFLCPYFEPIFNFMISILEKLSLLLSNINIGRFVFIKLNFFIYIIYLLLVFIIIYFINKSKYKFILIIFFLLIIHYNIPSLINNYYVEMLDVGQGDSIFMRVGNKNILIDTGGIEKYEEYWQRKRKNYSIAKSIIIPHLKSMGVHKIDYLITSHGDFDHMGEAINLVNNFKVEKVILNCGAYNDLENELIKILDKKRILHYSCIKELNIDKNKFYFLQTKEYDNENDNSNVIYADINSYKFLFMGDASVTTEKEVMSIYNLPDIDVLKVGHHGSRTSSSEEFIDEVNPKYSIISVGKNNRYGHPNKEVLNNLKNSKIYRTDQEGSIIFKIQNDKLIIETSRS